MLRVERLRKRYGDQEVVRDVSVEVAEGEMLVLLGASGSGKTTTLKMLNRLVESDEGTVWIEGEDTRAIAAHELRRTVGYVFQGVGLFPHLTVEENVGVTPRLLGWEPSRIRDRSRELLAEMQLPELGARYPHELSGGQRQRIGVARALAAEPRIVLWDEPFGAVDPVTRDALQRLVERLSITGVFVTHDVAEAVRLADRIGVMHAGKLVQVATPADILAHPATPEVEALFEAPRRAARELLGETP
ncbi:MAG: ABC transporter ATP-binding protein [Myxococcota bacterium]